MEGTTNVVIDLVRIIYDTLYYLLSGWNLFLEYAILLGLFIFLIYHILAIRKDTSLWHDLKKWFASSIGAAFIVLICLYMSQGLFPNDEYTLWRYVLVRITGICIGVVGITGSILFIDAVSKGDWMGRIEKAEYGPTIILASFILALALIIVYA